MYIVSMTGRLLQSFSKWDLRSIKWAETWIRSQGLIVVKYGKTIMGTIIVTVNID